MSVIVKGMKMPETCDECLTLRLSFCATFKCYEKFPLQDELQRLPDCPLHPLPEKHGGLIDETPLMKYFLANKYEKFVGGYVAMMLMAAPTIVEADGD